MDKTETLQFQTSVGDGYLFAHGVSPRSLMRASTFGDSFILVGCDARCWPFQGFDAELNRQCLEIEIREQSRPAELIKQFHARMGCVERAHPGYGDEEFDLVASVIAIRVVEHRVELAWCGGAEARLYCGETMVERSEPDIADGPIRFIQRGLRTSDLYAHTACWDRRDWTELLVLGFKSSQLDEAGPISASLIRDWIGECRIAAFAALVERDARIARDPP